MKYFIGVLIGAVIGYITNWVAIKMLFRPHYEKKLFGLKLPFTPGLIPKEKSRIAKSVGETIGNHLLTTETMVGALKDDNIKKHLKKIIEEKITNFTVSEQSINDVFKGSLGNRYEGIKLNMQIKASNYIVTRVRSEEFINNFSMLFINKVQRKLLNKPDKLKKMILDENFINKLINKFQSISDEEKSSLEEYINSTITAYIEGFIKDDKEIREVIPSEILAALNFYITNEKDVIADKLSLVLREKEIMAKIKEAIKDNVLAEMNPLASMFVNVDSVYEKFLAAIDSYLREDENKVSVVAHIKSLLFEMSKKPVQEIISKLPENSGEMIKREVSKAIVENVITVEVLKDGLSRITSTVDGFKSYHEILLFLSEDYEKNIFKYTKEILKTAVSSEEVERKVSNIIETMFNKLLNVPINDVLESYSDDIKNSMNMITNNIYDKFIEKEATNIISLIDIPRIVENQINSFDVDYAEKIILGISRKELSAITWLGALLGGIIGILSPLLSSL